MGLFSDVFSIGNAVGSSLFGGGGKSDRVKQYEDWNWQLYQNRKDTNIARKRQLADRKSDRAYAARLRKADKAYFEKTLRKDRQYAARLKKDDRNYAARLLAQDRKYAAKQLAGDRSYAERRDAAARAAWDKRSNELQGNASRLAEKSAASRGIDFTRLISDATKAGLNPMTALSFAGAYDTSVNYAEMRSPFGGSAVVPMSNGPMSGGGAGASAGPMAGGGVGASTPVATGMSAPAAGGMSFTGGGYSGESSPHLASGAFVADAVERAVTAFNSPPDKDPLADALRSAFSLKVAQENKAERTPRAFGYALTDVEPFRPAGAVSKPIFSSGSTRMTGPLGATSESDPLTVPSSLPIKTPFGDIQPTGDWSDAAVLEERYGEPASWAYGAAATAYDIGDNIGRAVSKRAAEKHMREGGRAYYDGHRYRIVDEPRDYSGPQFPSGGADWLATGANMKRPALDPFFM